MPSTMTEHHRRVVRPAPAVAVRHGDLDGCVWCGRNIHTGDEHLITDADELICSWACYASDTAMCWGNNTPADQARTA